MNPLSKQLAAAYAHEEQLYNDVDMLVEEQCRIMQGDPDPAAILAICSRIEDLMGQIESIEQRIGPVKEQWQQSGQDPDAELDAILAAVEKTISETARKQERVQDLLLEYLERQRQQMRGARDSFNAGRARSLYRAG